LRLALAELLLRPAHLALGVLQRLAGLLPGVLRLAVRRRPPPALLARLGRLPAVLLRLARVAVLRRPLARLLAAAGRLGRLLRRLLRFLVGHLLRRLVERLGDLPGLVGDVFLGGLLVGPGRRRGAGRLLHLVPQVALLPGQLPGLGDLAAAGRARHRRVGLAGLLGLLGRLVERVGRLLLPLLRLAGVLFGQRVGRLLHRLPGLLHLLGR